jgi:hypothetical protein
MCSCNCFIIFDLLLLIVNPLNNSHNLSQQYVALLGKPKISNSCTLRSFHPQISCNFFFGFFFYIIFCNIFLSSSLEISFYSIHTYMFPSLVPHRTVDFLNCPLQRHFLHRPHMCLSLGVESVLP